MAQHAAVEALTAGKKRCGTYEEGAHPASGLYYRENDCSWFLRIIKPDGASTSLLRFQRVAIKTPLPSCERFASEEGCLLSLVLPLGVSEKRLCPPVLCG